MNSAKTSPLRSWIDVPPDHDFPIQNLPYGVFEDDRPARVGVAIGEFVFDLKAAHDAGLFDGTVVAHENVFDRGSLNAFMALGRHAWSDVRHWLTNLLSADTPTLRDDAALRKRLLIPRASVRMKLPVEIGDFTDFYASKHHASNVGSMFRDPANPLTPNWVHMPIGYHGRAGSVFVSGMDVRRPCGQTKADDAPAPTFGPTRALDYELELGFFVGTGNEPGQPIPIDRAADHLFGMVLLNDWSARDIQRWEYVPLGPFLGKSFATSISPWVVPLDALAPFRVEGPAQSPLPLPHLVGNLSWGLDIELEVLLKSAAMREPARVSRVNFRAMYWSIVQMLAHHASNGTPMRTGDLCGTGTISGETEDSRGCLLELSWKGTKPVHLPGGELRSFLQDGDTVVMRGGCQGDGYRVGFGEVSAKVLSALGD